MLYIYACVCSVTSVMSNSLHPSGLQLTRSSLSMGFSRQEYCPCQGRARLPCPPPEDLPNPGVELAPAVAPALQADSSPLSHWEIPWYIYRMEYCSAMKNNEIMPFAATWIDLESVLLSEVSQREKKKYHMTPFIRGI